jgi:hypothetical protein
MLEFYKDASKRTHWEKIAKTRDKCIYGVVKKRSRKRYSEESCWIVDMKKTIGYCLFLGVDGVGKTELAALEYCWRWLISSNWHERIKNTGVKPLSWRASRVCELRRRWSAANREEESLIL